MQLTMERTQRSRLHDTTGRLRREVDDTELSVDTVATSMGTLGENLFPPGNFQAGTVGGSAPGFTGGSGQPLNIDTTVAYSGDRSGKFHHASADNSIRYFDIDCTDGDVYEVATWIQTQNLISNASAHSALQVIEQSGTTSLTTLGTKIGQSLHATRPDVGWDCSINRGWSFLRTTFRTNGSGFFRVHAQFGYGTTIQGDCWFDDLTVRKLNPAVNVGGHKGALALNNHATRPRLNDQRHIPMLGMGGVLSIQNSLTVLSAVDAGTTATISIAAHTLVFGFGNVSYNSGSITGLAFGVTYYVYADDPDYGGGAVTYVATAGVTVPAQSDSRYYVGKITAPADGGGGSSGGGGGGGRYL